MVENITKDTENVTIDKKSTVNIKLVYVWLVSLVSSVLMLSVGSMNSHLYKINE